MNIFQERNVGDNSCHFFTYDYSGLKYASPQKWEVPWAGRQNRRKLAVTAGWALMSLVLLY